MAEMETPCYVITSNGYRDSVSYQDDWCYGASSYIGKESETETARDLIKADIRAHWAERNGLPLYWVSDHGNVNRVRRVRLRRR